MSRIRRIAPGLGRGGLLGNTEGPEAYLRELDTLPSQFCRATGGTETVISQGGKYYRVHTFTDTDPTSLLLNFDGANGSTTFTDDSGWGHAVTANGNAAISTTQSKFGGSSAAFDGTGDWAGISAATPLSFSTGAFTVECWFNVSSYAATGTIVGQYNGLPAGRWLLSILSTGKAAFSINGLTGGNLQLLSAAAVSTGTWNHIAGVRLASGEFRLYLNGALENSASRTGSMPSVETQIGGFTAGGVTQEYFNGYIDSLRITKGQALYTAAFTPSTTALTRVGSGSLTFTRGGAVEYLVVGGGGGGGTYGGGGGAGGMIESSATVKASSQFVGVGGGGSSTANGQDSSFTQTAIGGGAGGSITANGNNGGSGGGASAGGTTYVGGSGTSGQGNDGGDSTFAGSSGGGGGAGAVGGSSSSYPSGAGGSGSQSSISGSATYYSGGGGGGAFNTVSYTAGSGGTGGGGNGSKTTTATSGQANTGGGGGGGGGDSGIEYTGGSGGSGIVIARYRITQAEYGGSPLLDIYSGAAAAYSLRSLSSSYTGPVVTVRRSSDDAEADFTASEVAGGALATWVGANDGFVTTWYDQSGNGNNAVQATSGAQPKIVSSGSLVQENGRPAMQFDGTSDFLISTSVGIAQPSTYFIVARRNSLAGKQNYIDGNISSGRQEVAISPSTDQRFLSAQAATLLFGTVAGTSQELNTAIFNGAASSLFVNGVLNASGNAGIDPLDELVVGADIDRSDYLEGTMQELVIYASDMSSQRIDIEAEISQVYGI